MQDTQPIADTMRSAINRLNELKPGMDKKNIMEIQAYTELLRHKISKINNTQHLHPESEVTTDNFINLRSALDYIKLAIEELNEVIV